MTTFDLSTDEGCMAALVDGQDNPILVECSLRLYRGFRADGVDPMEAGSMACIEMIDLIDLLPDELPTLPTKDIHGNPIHFTDKDAIADMKTGLPEYLSSYLEFAYWSARDIGLGINSARSQGLRAVAYALHRILLENM